MSLRAFRAVMCLSATLLLSAAFAQTTKYDLPNGHFNFKLALADMEGKDAAKSGAAVKALSGHGATAIRDIFGYLAEGKYPDFRMGLANIALAYESDAKPFLIEALASDNKFIRLIAAKVISEGADEKNELVLGPHDGEFIEGSSRKWLLDSDIRQAMINTSEDGDPKVRIKAIDYCVYARATEVVEQAMKLMADKTVDPAIRWQAVEAMAKMDIGKVSEILELVKDVILDQPSFLSNIGTETAYQLQLGFLRPDLYKSEESYGRCVCLVLMALESFNRKESVSVARKYLSSPYPNAKLEAASLLGMAGGPAVLAELIEMSKSKDPELHEGAILGIAGTKSPKAYDLICKFVEKGDQYSARAVLGFTMLADLRAIKFLEPYTRSKNKAMKKAATETREFLKSLKEYQKGD